MSEVEYLTFERTQYFSRSWKMLTRDKGWIKPVLLLTVGALVPIVGPLCVLGYAMEWARLTAWGVKTAPKQTNVDLGGCLSAGWRAFVVMLVWGLLYGLACLVLSFVFVAIPGINVLWSIAQQVGSIFVGVIAIIAALRATIYQKIGAGLEFREVFNMLKSDFGGVARITGLNCVCGLVVGAIAFLVFGTVFAIVLGGSMGTIIQIANLSNSEMSSDAHLYLPLISQLITNGIPAAVLCGILVSFFGNIINLVVTNACGLWMLQFDVASWGSDTQPAQNTTKAAPTRPADIPEQDEVIVETVIPVSGTTQATEVPAEPAAEPVVETSAVESDVEPAAEESAEQVDDAPAEKSEAPAEQAADAPAEADNAAADKDAPAE